MRSLRLDRGPSPKQTATIPWNLTKELGQAIGTCQELRDIHINRFRNIFGDAIKYLINDFGRLTNLERLSLKETYLYRHLCLLVNKLETLSRLHSITLDRCALVSHHDFYILALTVCAPRTPLTELNLGSSPIILVGFLELLHGFSDTSNDQLNLIWSPPSEYLENEAVLEHEKKAVGWDESRDAIPISSDSIKALALEKDDKGRFNIASQKLQELLTLLKQRRNPTKITKLQFTITDPLIDLPIMRIKISSCLTTLGVLEITASNELHSNERQLFVIDRLLEKATHLHTFKLVNFKSFLYGNFSRTSLPFLLALTTLSNLKVLSLNGTYLSEDDSKLLEKILQKKTVIQLDVTNSGFVTDASKDIPVPQEQPKDSGFLQPKNSNRSNLVRRGFLSRNEEAGMEMEPINSNRGARAYGATS